MVLSNVLKTELVIESKKLLVQSLLSSFSRTHFFLKIERKDTVRKGKYGVKSMCFS